MNRILRYVAFFLILFGGYYIFSCFNFYGIKEEGGHNKKVKIGIIQAIEHPALNRNREGLIAGLTQKGYLTQGDNVNTVIHWESAQANPSLAAQIAQKFMGQQMDVVVTLGTLPSQAMLQTRHTQNQTKKPFIVYSSVTDPKQAQLLEESYVVGVSNYVPSLQQFEFIKKICPSVQTIGIIYNPGDPNSQSLVRDMNDGAKKLKLKLILAQAHNTSGVVTAARSILEKVDCFFINNDNTALSAFQTIVAVAREVKKPVFTSDVELMNEGAFGSLGPDQYELGQQTSDLVDRALKGDVFEKGKVFYPSKVESHTHSKEPH